MMNKKNTWKQKLHLEPLKGWLNDPNGLCFFKGMYHVYFQYSPDDAYGKSKKCWGHFKSADFINWDFTGTVLYPDNPDDRSGVYSGCAVPCNDKIYLFYTGNVKEDGDFDYITEGRKANIIMVTTPDGEKMSKKTTLLKNADYPAFCSCHVRDPKVYEENGKYKMVLGARTLSGTGCALFYVSDNLTKWQFEKEVNIMDFGFMWECPDVLCFGDNKYLSVSPQGLPHEDYRFQNVYSSGYFKYEADALKGYTEWDYGFDFYAPQTFKAQDGRTIMIGWMGIGDIPYKNPTAEKGWQHCLTLPREISEREDGVLLQQPVRELKKLRVEKRQFKKDCVNIGLPFELYGKTKGDFKIKFCEYLALCYADGVFSIEFSDETVGGGRTVRKTKLFECKDIRVIADTSSLEIYLNGGEKVLSTRFYPENTEVTLTVCGFECELYSLRGLKVNYVEN